MIEISVNLDKPALITDSAILMFRSLLKNKPPQNENEFF